MARTDWRSDKQIGPGEPGTDPAAVPGGLPDRTSDRGAGTPAGDPARDDTAGDTASRYVILDHCAEQRHRLLHGRDKRYQRPVAIHLLPITDEKSHTRLINRINAMLDLPPHPNLPAFRDDYRDDEGRHYLVTEWVQTVPIVQADGPADSPTRLPVAVAIDQLAQLAEVLELLHHGKDPLVHGALSPCVVRVTPDGRVVLFGAEGAAAIIQAWRPPAATVPYLAPEVLAGREPIVASDVYGLAALAWQLLTGTVPGGSSTSRLGDVCREPRLIEQLLRAGMAVDPSVRPQSAREFMDRLRIRFDRTLPTGTVTFLLTDICRSTELWDAAPDEMAAAVERHDRLCVEVIEKHGGLLPRDQGEGDSMFVAFPRATDAVACAAELQKRLSTDDWPAAVPLRVRMALHTGEAIVQNDNYRGVAVNLCARLRDAAHGGQVLMSQTTAELVRATLPDGMEIVDLGLHQMRNLQRAVRVFELRGPGLSSDFPALRGPGGKGRSAAPHESVRLFGRANELGLLFDALDLAEQAHRQTILISGEPGIGKTSLCTEVAAHAKLKDALVVWSRGVEGEASPSSWLWHQVLRSLLDQCGDQELAECLTANASNLARFSPDIARRLGLPTTTAQPDANRFHQLQALADFLRSVAASRTLVLIFEDLHWADDASLNLLELMIDELEDVRLLCLATYSVETPIRRQQLAHALGGLARQASTTRIVLEGLPEDQVGAFIMSLADVEPTPAVVDAVYTTTEGNPFYVRELVRLLAAEGRLDERRFDGRMSLPLGVRDVVRRRIDRISEDCGLMLALASVVGRELRLDVLAQLSELPTERLMAALDEAVSAGLVVSAADQPHRYTFSHALVRQAIYESLNSAVRVRQHMEMARILKSEPNPAWAEVAYHLIQVGPWGDLDEAVQTARRAGDEAVLSGAYEDSCRLYRSALDVLDLDPTAPADMRIGLLLREGDALWRAGHPLRARKSVQEATALATETGDAAQIASTARRLANIWAESGVYDRQSADALNTALPLIDAGELAARAEVLSRVAMEQVYSDHPELGPAYSREAVEVARASGDRRATAFALLARRYTLVRPDLIDQRLEVITDSVRLADEAGDRELGLRARLLRLIDLYELGRDADAECEALIRDLKINPQPQFLGFSSALNACTALSRGRFEQTRKYVEETLHWAEWCGRDSMAQAALFQQACLNRETGQVGELLPRVQHTAERPLRVPGWHALLAVLHLDLGDTTRAWSILDELASSADIGIVRDTTWLGTICLLAQSAVRLGEVERCEQFHRLLKPYSGRAVVAGIATPVVAFGSIDRYLGQLAAVAGRWDEAAHRLAAAADFNRRIGARPWLAHTQLDQARMLFGRALPGDDGAAEVLLSQALGSAQQLGMPFLAQQIMRTWRDRSGLVEFRSA